MSDSPTRLGRPGAGPAATGLRCAVVVAVVVLLGLGGCSGGGGVAGPEVPPPGAASPSADPGSPCPDGVVETFVLPMVPMFSSMEAGGAKTASRVGSRADLDPAGLGDHAMACVVVLTAVVQGDGGTMSIQWNWTALNPDARPSEVGALLADRAFDKVAPDSDFWTSTTHDGDTTTTVNVQVVATDLPDAAFRGAKYALLDQIIVEKG